jgi:hypothetical protein
MFLVLSTTSIQNEVAGEWNPPVGLDNRTVRSDFGWKMQIRVTTVGGKMKPTAVRLLQRLVRVTGYSDAGLVGRFARFQEMKESSARR